MFFFLLLFYSLIKDISFRVFTQSQQSIFVDVIDFIESSILCSISNRENSLVEVSSKKSITRLYQGISLLF